MADAALAHVDAETRSLSPTHAMVQTIERRYDAAKINRLANHPDIVEWVRGYTPLPLDLSDLAADRNNIVLVGDHGAMMFVQRMPNIFECHTLVAPEGRGEWAKGFVPACFHLMFTRSTCLEIITRIPKGNLGARTMANLCKMQPQFVHPRGWVLKNDPIPAEWFAIDVRMWMLTAPGLTERGHWFHDRLAQEFKRLGKDEDNHPDDDVHDRFVGAAYEFLLGGQTGKAEVFYNRYAVMADYRPIAISNTAPLIVDIGSAVICFNRDDDDFYAVKVR